MVGQLKEEKKRLGAFYTDPLIVRSARERLVRRRLERTRSVKKKKWQYRKTHK